jgi:hypothetical protein
MFIISIKKGRLAKDGLFFMDFPFASKRIP